MPDLYVVGTTAIFVNGSAQSPKTVFNASGGTLYYKNAADVSSSSNDGNITAGNSVTATAVMWIVSTTAVNVIQLAAEQADSQYLDALTVNGASAFTGAVTTTGGIAGGVPYNVATWQPIAATSGTDTACSNGTAYVGSVFLPKNATVTGISYLVGSVGGTDKVVASLHDISGTPLANSATAGATVGTAAQVQAVALTATYAAKGPAFYFVALTFNGTTAKFRSIPAHTQAGVIGNGVTQTFGTVAAFTAPTTFTADKAPVAFLY